MCAQTRDSDWQLTLEVVTTPKGQQLNATVSLVLPEGAIEFGAGHVRRSNPILEVLHRDSTNSSVANAWRREDMKISFGWRTFDAKSQWRHTIENVCSLRAIKDSYLLPNDSLIIRYKFNEYERGSVESWADPSAGGKSKERLNGYAACTYQNGNQYVGSWVAGRQTGSGEFVHARPSYSKYVGQFADGIRHGLGEFTFSDGTRYNGAWNAGMQHGKGKWHFAHDSGTVEGEWFEGKLLRGRGQFLNFDSGAQYMYAHTIRSGPSLLHTVLTVDDVMM